ncbi:nuclear transport factor 2 family protein [Flavobacterium sufflavum]|uniref:Nuclear transport factor 2 family protein n=1 Tax=Flavobacterium sufflavum TaxID=1921138 RepID=A0A437KTE0_9FLAO|nr:nuclear transport factor 2 family protein [Flavobacterium sufflavum]RVT75353.1 nuclear transport factor 2 family protein [Flavobacterium sufflavum]
MTPSEKIIHQLYTSIANGAISEMESCYSPNVKFHDPIFGTLKGMEVPKMWKMLIEKSKENLAIEYTIIKSNTYKGTAQWTAIYTFGKNKRQIKNIIKSEFHFKDGLIIKQNDDFNIWNWAKQAFGFSGFLFGWTGYMQKKIHDKAKFSLKNYKEAV